MKEGWHRRRVGDLCEVIAGQSPEGKFYNTSSKGMPFYQGKKDFGEKLIGPPTVWTTQTTKIARKGDVLMSVRAPVGPVNLATAEVCIGRGLAAIRSGTELNRDFLFYQLVYLQPAIAGREGAVFASINKSEIEALPIAYAPLSEQRRVVASLDETFAAVATARANTEQNLRHARELFESQLNAFFTRRSPGWVERRLSVMCDEITVGYVGSMASQYKEGGIPFLRSQNIRPFEVSLDNVVFIDESFHRSLAKSRLRPGDVAVVRTGFPGTAAVIPRELPDANCADLVIVRPGREVNPNYLAAFFNSTLGKGLVAGRLVGAAQKHFNVTAAKAVTLPVPPMSVQQEAADLIRSLLTATQRVASVYERKLAALDALKQSLLHQAFTGGL